MTRKSFLSLSALALLGVATTHPAAAADLKTGMEKAKACRTCHGIDGIAKIPIAPHLAGENSMYIITQLKAFKTGKREHEMMSVIAAGLSEDDMRDIAEWYSAIKISVEIPHEGKIE